MSSPYERSDGTRAGRSDDARSDDDRSDDDRPDDALRAQLARLDPMSPSAVPVPVAPARAAELLEAAMSDTSTQTPPADPATAGRPRRGIALMVAAAAAVLVIGGGVAALTGGDEPSGGGTAAGGGTEPTSVTLALPQPDAAASCIQFDVSFLAQMPTALAGTVSAVEGSDVVLDVDTWYAGGDADQVVLTGLDPGLTAADGSFGDFVVGERYLVTAAESGTVNGCGFTGPATPEFESYFEQAFPR